MSAGVGDDTVRVHLSSVFIPSVKGAVSINSSQIRVRMKGRSDRQPPPPALALMQHFMHFNSARYRREMADIRKGRDAKIFLFLREANLAY